MEQQQQVEVTARSIVECLEGKGCVFANDDSPAGFKLLIPEGMKGEEEPDIRRMAENATEVRRYLTARHEHVNRLIVVPQPEQVQ